MFRYVAGNFPDGANASHTLGMLMLSWPDNTLWGATINLSEKNVASVEALTEETKDKLLGKVAWGAVGLAMLGPAGALAGLLLGGKSKEIAFVCRLKPGITEDGSEFMGVADSKTYQKLLALTFKKGAST